MAKKKDNKKWIIVIVIVVALLMIQPGGINKTSENVQNLVKTVTSSFGGGGGAPTVSGNPNLGDPNADFLSLKLYDKDGNEINTKRNADGTFSIVNVGAANITGVFYISYTVTVTNNGTQDLSCTPGTITPPNFDCTGSGCTISGTGPAITKGTQTAKAGNKTSWTSNLLPTSAITTGSNTLTVPVTCTFYAGGATQTLPTKTGTFTFSVWPDNIGGGDFKVDVSTGGVPSEYCGDTICQSPWEGTTTCPKDCLFVLPVKFRTSDLFYTSGSTIAYGGCTGAALTKYGYVANSTQCLGTYAFGSCPTLSGYTLLYSLSTGPVASEGRIGYPYWASAVTAGTSTGCLYNSTTITNQLMVAFQESDIRGPCGTTGTQWAGVSYNTAASSARDFNKVDLASGYAWDIDKEVSC